MINTNTKPIPVYYKNWEQESTDYTIIILRVTDKEYKRLGGRYLTLIMIGNQGQVYPLNSGFKHWSYIREKYNHLTIRDARIIAKELSEILKEKL